MREPSSRITSTSARIYRQRPDIGCSPCSEGKRKACFRFRFAHPKTKLWACIRRLVIKADNEAAQQVELALEDGYKSLLAPSMETETRQEAKKRADEEAIRVFAENLRELLLSAPLGRKRVLALDPGFRTGAKLVCLDSQGKAAPP